MTQIENRQKILIVDDTPANLDVLKGILQPDSTIFLAINGGLALKIARTQSPDLILLDIMMPELDGYEVCRQLKADQRTADIPVIFVTAKEDSEDESKGFEFGCVDYIKKPFNPAIVMARVKTHLALNQARETLERQNEELKAVAKLREDVERMSRHDLKNPLTAIFSCIFFLEADPQLSEKSKEYLKMADEAAQDMLQMINASLDMFKMEQHLYRPEFKNVDVPAIVRRLSRGLRPLVNAKESSILLCPDTIENSGFTVRGEELLVYSMMANLLKNALEATPENKPVTITLAENKEQAVIHIHNMGTVPEQLRDTIFEKYVTYGKKKGIGLGTYSAKLIARTLGGDITMESSEKEGTTFSVWMQR